MSYALQNCFSLSGCLNSLSLPIVSVSFITVEDKSVFLASHIYAELPFESIKMNASKY